METYALLKTVHVGAVVLSGAGFALRAAAALAGASWLRSRAARTLPHVVDTVLLSSAVAMAWIGGLSPLAQPWLAAKIGALLAYIGLGMMALKPGRSRWRRGVAAVAALATFGYIVAAAFTKSPWPVGP